MGNGIEFKPSRGAIAAAARKLGRHRQSVYRSFKAGEPQVLVAVAKEDLKIKKEMAALQKEFLKVKGRASRLAEAENIRLHDEYLRDAYPERMGDYINS